MKKTNNGSCQSTHWDGCWMEHAECAKAKVEDLEKKVSTLRAALERIAEGDWIEGFPEKIAQEALK